MSPASTSPARLLVRGVNWLGDAVMSTPALQRLREQLPGAHVTILTREKLAALWDQHPSIDSVLTFSAGESFWSVARRLRAGSFDTALVLPNSPRSALETWWARIPRRVGYARPWRTWMLTEAVPLRASHTGMRKPSAGEVRRLIAAPGTAHPRAAVGVESHHIHDYLHLAARLGTNPQPVEPKLRVLDSEVNTARQSCLAKLADRKTNSGERRVPDTPIWLGLNPGAAYGPAKRWPLDRFAEVTCQISRQHPDAIWLVFGSKEDEPCGRELEKLNPCVISLAGKTSLRQLMATLELCRVLLTNDSGPMHVAAALGVPVVVPFGSTSPEMTAPGLPGSTRHQLLRCPVVCAPCFLRVCPIDMRCMTGITVEQVVQAVSAVLAQKLSAARLSA